MSESPTPSRKESEGAAGLTLSLRLKLFAGDKGRRRGQPSRHFVGVSASICPVWLALGVQGAPIDC